MQTKSKPHEKNTWENQNQWQKTKTKTKPLQTKTCMKQDKIQLFVRKTKQNNTTFE